MNVSYIVEQIFQTAFSLFKDENMIFRIVYLKEIL